MYSNVFTYGKIKRQLLRMHARNCNILYCIFNSENTNLVAVLLLGLWDVPVKSLSIQFKIKREWYLWDLSISLSSTLP